MGLQVKRRDDLDSLFADLGAEMPAGVVLPSSSVAKSAKAEDPYARFLEPKDKKKAADKEKD